MENHLKMFWLLNFIQRHFILWLMLNLRVLGLIKKIDLLTFVMELDILCYLALKNMMPFSTGVDNL